MAQKEITRTTAKITDICEECSDPIRPGNALVIYVERYISHYPPGQEKFITRHYCEDCGKLLEDSLTTTEAS